MTDPITLDLACIRARAEACGPSHWDGGCLLANDDGCQCSYIFDEGHAGGVGCVYFGELGDGNDQPSKEEARNHLAHICGMDPPTTLALVHALEFARKEHDAIVREDTKEWRKQSDRADAAEAEAAKLRALVAELEEDVAGWKRVAVTAVIPLEALNMAGAVWKFASEVRVGICDGILAVRKAFAGEGFPPKTRPSAGELL